MPDRSAGRGGARGRTAVRSWSPARGSAKVRAWLRHRESPERELPAPLLVRATSARTPALGERVLPDARVARSAARSVEQIAADATETMTGTVRPAATPTVCQGLIPGLLRHWREDQPRITVRVFEGGSAEVSTWLENGTAGAAVLIDPPPGPGIQLAVDAYRASLPRDHPPAGEPLGPGPGTRQSAHSQSQPPAIWSEPSHRWVIRAESGPGRA
ncbi:MAG: hypothetical protein QOF44_613 [Streptomyces sp.]|nr:hypothetical protein [Streptomyces sp.]